MLFNIEWDFGGELAAYIVPDSPSETPRMRASAGDETLWEGLANEVRPALVAAGRHQSGLVGFRLGPNQIPDLAARHNLVLRDAASGLTIYRRRGDIDPVDRRVFRLETSFAPFDAIDHAVSGRYQSWYSGVERLGHETAVQTLELHAIPSVYVSGRLLFSRHLYLLERGYTTLVILRDPVLELAERIVVLSGGRRVSGARLTDRDRILFGPAIEALGSLDHLAPEAVRRRLRRLDRVAAGVLSNPLGRLLTSTRPDELCRGDAASAALRALSSFDLVGVEDHADWFRNAAQVMLEVNDIPLPAPFEDDVFLIADAIADLSIVQAMLEIDLEAFEAAASISLAVQGEGETHGGPDSMAVGG